MLTEEQMRDALRQCPHDTVENLRVRWFYAKDFARAIESAATAPLLARIAELERQLEEARKDAELGRTAMRFVDRAGDPHPGIDDADKICAEFYAAMCAVVEDRT